MIIKTALRILFFTIPLITIASSDSKLYIGFLGYLNPNNTDVSGNCCDGTKPPCNATCHLIFNVTVQGKSIGQQSLKLSTKPIESSAAEHFQLSNNKDPEIINPLMFTFGTWPYEVNITITVFHDDKGDGGQQIVDKFTVALNIQNPSWQYHHKNATGTRSHSFSLLSMIFRYECLKTKENDNGCFSRDCVLHQNETECLDILPPNNQDNTTDIVLQTTSRPYECGRFEVPNMGEFLNCTTQMTDTTEQVTQDITTQMNIEETTQANKITTQLSQLTDSVTTTKPTDDTSPTITDIPTKETSSVIPETTHADISTTNQASSVAYASQNTNSKVTSDIMEHHTSVNSVTTNEKHTSLRSSTNLPSTKQISESTSKSTTESIKTFMSSTPTNSLTIHVSTKDMNKTGIPSGPGIVSSPPTHSTDIPDINTTIKETNSGPMKYWPGIVGGVLGACVVVAVVSYIIYSRRRRINKRNNDIYNVNPKRWVLEPPEENGTSGKSEIALETEQV
ncbi:uncharacterized protein LOC143072334 [Mytilus galloprovincialis]|uniref:uncharacterized protein LOC143072334 n=1 Tax=Mytilus galloprovincialis TaxID=29158 RepID=UPI003F7C28F2